MALPAGRPNLIVYRSARGPSEGYRISGRTAEEIARHVALTERAKNISFWYEPGNALVPIYACCDLKTLSDFSAGAGDFLTGGLTQEIRQYLGSDSVVDKSSGWYAAGVGTGAALSIAIPMAKVSGLNPWLGKAALHSPHAGGPHQYYHLQLMLRTGISRTIHLRIPLWP